MPKVTDHFDSDEFRCHDGTAYPVAWRTSRLLPLCEVLEEIRAEVGCPIRILSGYRSPAWNARVKGAEKSQHVEGRAVDIVADGVSVARLHAVAMRLAKQPGSKIGGVGLYKSWIHVDVRPRKADGTIATWEGGGVGSES